jgi:hypothetical protein
MKRYEIRAQVPASIRDWIVNRAGKENKSIKMIVIGLLMRGIRSVMAEDELRRMTEKLKKTKQSDLDLN